MSKTTTHSAEISNENRSTTPTTERFTTYIRSQWADDAREIPAARPAAPYAAQRRSTLSEQFTGKRLVIEAGLAKQRSNDTFYIFRAHSAFSHLTGWGADALPGSILVLEPNASGHDATLFFPESAGKDTDEFFANPTVGEFWTGKRPSLAQVAGNLGLNTRSLAEFASEPGDVTLANADLARAVSELRLVKDEYEIEQMREAVMATEQGFNAVIEAFPRATQHPRGERVVEGAFGMQARLDGNGVGYETIAASGPHACTLHWEKNNGAVLEGDLLLLDAGIELDSLYTADITRTLPISGTFSPVQRKVYEAVLEAADAAHAIVRPGITFHEVHDTAMAVIERKTREWGFLPEKEEGDVGHVAGREVLARRNRNRDEIVGHREHDGQALLEGEGYALAHLVGDPIRRENNVLGTNRTRQHCRINVPRPLARNRFVANNDEHGHPGLRRLGERGERVREPRTVGRRRDRELTRDPRVGVGRGDRRGLVAHRGEGEAEVAKRVNEVGVAVAHEAEHLLGMRREARREITNKGGLGWGECLL